MMKYETLFLILLTATTNILQQNVVQGQMASANASKIFKQLMKGYDYRIIPTESGEPLDVHVNMLINDLVPDSESSSVSQFNKVTL